MKIGFDGKRAYQNKTGLGNYIRSLVAILTHHYPEHHYTLFAPKQTNLFDTSAFANVDAIFPETALGRKFPAWWRRNGMVKAIKNSGVEIFHGVSNELPVHIERSGVKSVVTIHDIIFERFPETYHLDERFIYRSKIKRACKSADAIIAISKQTKDDLVDLYGVAAEKIFICYQSCNPIFQQQVPESEKEKIKNKYGLPDRFFLFVSSIAPRKNLITICRAMASVKDQLSIPLVVIGDGKKEKEEAKELMRLNGIKERLILLNEMPPSREADFTTAADFPAIYQLGTALVYPSIFEGFGAPLLEALYSGLPVISSNTSSLPEVAGEAALYFQPYDHELLATHMQRIANDNELSTELKEKGFRQAEKFGTANYAQSIMDVYKFVCSLDK